MAPPVVLFGYDSSPFTNKVKFALRIKQVPYNFIIVPSMMPRPILRENLQLTYRKIPICIIGREVYCDTSIILEALEDNFPPSQGYGSIYPVAQDGRAYRSLIRGFASYWTDRPLFRITTGLIPGRVWRTRFGQDRSRLIGHKLDADKLEQKIPQNLSGLDLQLSVLEPLFAETNDQRPWVLSTEKPSLADVALFYQLDWGNDIAAGRGTESLTGGGTYDEQTALGATPVFNAERYPNLHRWFAAFRRYHNGLPSLETRLEDNPEIALRKVRDYSMPDIVPLLLTPAAPHVELDSKNGLVPGIEISVAPDDTGREE